MIHTTNKLLLKQARTRPPSSKEDVKAPAPSIFLVGCERITRSRNQSLFILLQSWRKWCRYSLLHTLKKEEAQKESEWVELWQKNMMKEYSKGSTKKAHSNTDEDHHRQLYENRLLYYLFQRRQRASRALGQSLRLQQVLWNQCYHVCYVLYCKMSLCCELAVLKELKCMLGGSIDFLPLKTRVFNHFCDCLLLQDPLVKSETLVSIVSNSKDFDNLFNQFCIHSSQESQLSEKPTHYKHLPSRFDIDPEYVMQFFKQDDYEKYEQWQYQLLSDLGEIQMARIEEGEKIYFVLNTNDMYEEMREEYERSL